MTRGTILGLALLAGTTLGAQAQTSDGGIDWGERARSVLGQESGGSRIAELQQALARAGYDPGSTDGRMGPGTEAAIRAYERDNNLPVTGEPSAQLHARLQEDSRYAGSQDRAGGMLDRDTVADLQYGLRNRGYPISEITGQMNSETQSAIRAYQRDNGMRVTGEPSRQLLASLQGQDQGRGTRTADEGRDYRDDTGSRDMAERTELLLRDKGYEVGEVDGRLDQQSAAAIEQYQRQRGMEVTGRPSRQLLADLERSDTRAEGQPGDLATGLFRQLERGLQQGQQGQQGSR